MTPTLTRVADKLGLPCYAVHVDGTLIGHVYRTETSWSRKPAGRRYVTASGVTTRYWTYDHVDTPSHAWRPKVDTRTEAVRRLIDERS